VLLAAISERLALLGGVDLGQPNLDRPRLAARRQRVAVSDADDGAE